MPPVSPQILESGVENGGCQGIVRRNDCHTKSGHFRSSCSKLNLQCVVKRKAISRGVVIRKSILRNMVNQNRYHAVRYYESHSDSWCGNKKIEILTSV